MKPKKTYKSLTELSVDSISAVNSEPEKRKPPQPRVARDDPLKIPRESLSRVSEGRGYHRWGINE